jgi:predicted GH43/DUF377 family glycosyl hydrolase
MRTVADAAGAGWSKQGLLFTPSGEGGWMNSHAQVPTALLLDDRIRVYVASRPKPGLSLTGYIDLDIERPDRVLAVSDRPILDPGGPGTFDEHGIMPSAVIADGDLVRLYYSGWSRLAGAAPYHNTTGLAVSDDGGRTFRRACEGPVLDRSPYEAFSATSPCVLRHEGQWHVFYSAGLGWLEIDGKQEHIYDLRHATSQDGIDWRRTRRPAIAQAFPEEALTRPTILERADGGWAMWFCHRGSHGFRGGGDAYRIGFARSDDLVEWTRDDAAAGIGVSPAGFDSEMIAYPCVLRVGERLLMFYNGNGFGRDGLAWAVWG